jgi:type II secretory pathway component HofQ
LFPLISLYFSSLAQTDAPYAGNPVQEGKSNSSDTHASPKEEARDVTVRRKGEKRRELDLRRSSFSLLEATTLEHGTFVLIMKLRFKIE